MENKTIGTVRHGNGTELNKILNNLYAKGVCNDTYRGYVPKTVLNNVEKNLLNWRNKWGLELLGSLYSQLSKEWHAVSEKEGVYFDSRAVQLVATMQEINKLKQQIEKELENETNKETKNNGK